MSEASLSTRVAFVEAVRGAIDIVGEISKTVSLLKWSESASGIPHWAGQCPFCKVENSFRVRRDPSVFHCFACKRGGDVFGYVMERDELKFWDAVVGLGRVWVGDSAKAGWKDRGIEGL